MAQADAEASAYAAAMAAAAAEAEVAVAVEAAASALADAAAYAYAAAGAEASAQVRAYAAARAFAAAEADAYASAQALALAMADAVASARAAAEATARASVAAEATAEALSQAFAMASAAANAEATARTSVQVVPDIQTSVESFIDPECLAPVCREAEYIPCPPCEDGETPGPTVTPTPVGCDDPEEIEWNFGVIPSGVNFRGSKSVPSNIQQQLGTVRIIGTIPVADNLPPNAQVELNLEERICIVSGTFAPQSGYYITYELLDPVECPAFLFTIFLRTEGGILPEPEPEPEPARQPEVTPLGCITVSAVRQTTAFLFIPATTSEIPVSMVVNRSQERVTPFQFCGTGMAYVVAPPQTYGQDQESTAFGRWERYVPSEDGWETISTEPSVNLPIVGGAKYRAVYSQAGITITPVPRPSRVCVSISAVYMYQRIALDYAPTTAPSFVTEPIYPQFTIDEEEYRNAPFELCGSASERRTIEAEDEHWTRTERRLEFWKWQRYNTEAEQWEDLMIFRLFGGPPANVLDVTLEDGLQLRAVYRQATELELY